MSENKDKLNTLVEEYVTNLLTDELPDSCVYHNVLHTIRVVKSVKELIEHYKLADKEEQALIIACWFHDVGYIHGTDGHEQHSVSIATEFLTKHHADSELIALVKRLILATEFKKEPEDLLEEIISDADSSHFAKDYFKETSALLRLELQQKGEKNFTSEEWLNENIRFFTEEHRYYTDYALRNWEPEKHKNLQKLMKSKKKKEARRNKEKLKVRLKDESPQRSVQTLYRVTMRNHLKLSDIADTKANILLSVNAIIISLALSNLIPKLDSLSNRHLMIPTFVLIIASVASIVLSIMSTRPNVTSGEFTDEEVRKRKVNILFFGNFYKMPFDKFNWAMNEVINDKSYIHDALTKDLYLLGVVLNRKYRLLRLTYNIFMIGIIASVISFAVAFYLLDSGSPIQVIPS
ncbi:MAG: DUF5706 domain-containing protein [Flavobacteriaceae bacterium]|nr:DUF5706 domain-containing protein [Flavobacteriaceae bacterium]